MRICFVLLLACLLSDRDSARAEKPDVLFLFADDQSYETLGMLGLMDVETPNLDRLAARSKRFLHAYNMGSWSGAVCVASRAMLNTGRHLWRAEKAFSSPPVNGGRKGGLLWAEMMSQAGYRTCFTGKWHVQASAEQVFDVARNVRGGMPQTVPSSYNRPLAGKPDEWSPSDPSIGGFWEGGRHWSEVTADDAVDFLQMSAESKEPHFMYIAFNAPHDPRQSPQEFVDRYPPQRVVVPPTYLPQYPHADQIGAGPNLRDEKLAPFPRTEEAVQVHRGEYFALITHMDAQIGRILDALEKSGKADNTWIFFTADHGLAVGHHGLFGKQNMYEHSLRVPFLVAGPGVEPGSIEAPVYLQDAMATSLAIAGAKKPEHVEFQSLLPLIRGESEQPTAQPVYCAYLALQRAVIDDGWKLMVYPKASVVRLYDLAEDPLELRDLAQDPAHLPKIRELFETLFKLQQTMGDTTDLRAVFEALPAA